MAQGERQTVKQGVILDSFDMIRIVNLPERRDRRREMMRELRKVGLADDPRVAFFPAIRPADKGNFSSIGAHGVYQSQRAILREAAAKKASVLILEDDCDFTADTESYATGTPWDIFYGGYYAADPANLQTSDIIGAHMMGFTAEAARRISAYEPTLGPGVEHPPIDGLYVWFRRDNPDVATAFAVPPIGNQRASRSDIAAGKIFDRIPVVRDLVELLRRLRRRFRASAPDRTGRLDW